MEKSVIIFFIWMGLIILGAIVKAKKKSERKSTEESRPHQATLDEILEKMTGQQEYSIKQTEAPQADPIPEEGTPATPQPKADFQPKTADAPKAAAASKVGKDDGLDIDPVEMVIYSEIMEPGYKKY